MSEQPPVTDADAATSLSSPIGAAIDTARPGGAATSRTTAARCRSAPGCASRGRSSRSVPLVLLVLIFRVALNVDFAELAEQHREREQAAPAGRVPRVLPRLPAARPALGDPAAGAGDQHRRQGLDRDPVPVVARQLPRPGQAGRRVPGVPAQDQRRRVVGRGRSAPCSSSASWTCSRSRSWASRPASGASGRASRPRSSSWRSSASGSSSRSPSCCSRSATSAGGSSALPLPAARRRVLRPVRGGRVLRSTAASSPGLVLLSVPIWTTEGAAAVLRRQGARLPGRRAGHLGRGVRRPHRFAADGRAAEPGGPRDRRARHRRRPDARLRGAAPEATTIVLLDRVISVFSVIVIGSILYVVSPSRRARALAAGRGRRSGELTRSGPQGSGTRSSERLRPDRTRPHRTSRSRTRNRARPVSTNG